MKKDIPQYKVEDLAIAIVPRRGREIIEDNNAPMDIDLWDTYIINFKEDPISSVLVNSRGYGELEGNEIKTTVLRHFFEEIGPMRVVKVEPIQTKLFELTNEYWVSFQYNGYMYDKRYVFVKGSISEMNFTKIPFLDQKGVMIK